MSFWDNIRKFGERLPVVGGLVKGIAGSPEEEAHQKLLQQFGQASAKERYYDHQNRMGQFQNMMNAFAPMNNLMGQMYGQGATRDLSQFGQDTMPQGQQQGMFFDAFGKNDQSPQAMGMIPNPNQTPEEKAQNVNAWIPAPQKPSAPTMPSPNQQRGQYGQSAFSPYNANPNQNFTNRR